MEQRKIGNFSLLHRSTILNFVKGDIPAHENSGMTYDEEQCSTSSMATTFTIAAPLKMSQHGR
jgi:hypothetical protein